MSTPELHWFKSSYSDSSNGNDCVEVASTPATIHIRDSKRPDSSHLTVARTTWADFLPYVTK
ncbi:DUF397 domain-containing protein [Streptomyces sp. 15-116A]|uniref:DUF397 domain-containing protein n=1 Tax=Streptomyces sp. 15-116A TaxID=2259035 RepID=UPI0021B49808|nr:DUF397 domain-containing protein [Streptomyces sp. 15-116A]MCT7353168.1 DUF397 domain-containing protein [Streptomyces sp. 15-116A]